MLAVTEAAAEAIRFAMKTEADSQAALALTVAPAPAEGDQVVTANESAQVFLEEQAADFLSDKVLDVQPDNEGQLTFAVLDQS